MNSTFVTAGLACVIAAIAGGGLKAFSIEIPLLSSVKRQAVLGILGAGLLAAGLLMPAPTDEPKPGESSKPSLKIAGRVLDNSERPISSASVIVGGQILGTTDALGNFSIPVIQEDVTVSISSPSHRPAQFNVHAPQSASVFHLEALAKELKSVPANDRKLSAAETRPTDTTKSTDTKKPETDAKGGDVKPVIPDPAPKTERGEGAATHDNKTDAPSGVASPQPSLRDLVQRAVKELRDNGDLTNARRILSTIFGTNASTWDRQRVFSTLDSRINSASEQDLQMVKQILGIH